MSDRAADIERTNAALVAAGDPRQLPALDHEARPYVSDYRQPRESLWIQLYLPDGRAPFDALWPPSRESRVKHAEWVKPPAAPVPDDTFSADPRAFSNTLRNYD